LSIWCYDPPETGPATFVNGANSWIDDFNHHLSLADIGPGYRVFGDGAGQQFLPSQHWRHNDHWMVDVRGRDAAGAESNWGGTAMRPDRSFRYINGRLVIETDVAAGIAEYSGGAWPELVVTTAPAPTTWIDPLYTYGQFKGHWTVGCRLPPGRVPICALHDPTGRRWEIAAFIPAGSTVFGGEPGAPGSERDRAWRVCQGTDPDTNCRDRFRMELTRDSLKLLVNGVRYFEITNIPTSGLMDALVNADVYTYFGSWIYRPDVDTVRFHWDRVAVNPDATTPPVSCSPRPRVAVSTASSGPGRLQVTVAAQGANNQLQALNFTATNNARIDVAGRSGATGSFQVPLTSRPQQVTFTVQRVTTGVAMYVPFTVVDGCGNWQTFVGAGPTSP
jgi:hypothetical protein